MQIEREAGCGKALGIEPTIGAQREVANARFTGEFPTVFKPMIEPAQQERVGIEQSLGAEVLFADYFSPWDMDPGPGYEILISGWADMARKPSTLPPR